MLHCLPNFINCLFVFSLKFIWLFICILFEIIQVFIHVLLNFINHSITDDLGFFGLSSFALSCLCYCNLLGFLFFWDVLGF
jgi:hypothetical protein